VVRKAGLFDVFSTPSAIVVQEEKKSSAPSSFMMAEAPDLVDESQEFARVMIERQKHAGFMQTAQFVLSSIMTTVIIGATVFYISLVMKNSSNQNNMMNFTKSRAKMSGCDKKGEDEGEGEVPSVTFDMVAGLDGAKRELQEVADFLKNPEKYTRVGAKIPKGVLLEGPSGTGKTLLARAVAGESRVPFFSASASEFVEMFVGVGASRVRSLFSDAKAKAPCIIFIDELDAVGKARGGGGPGGVGGGNDEREQTVNQLLTEMNGFEPNAGVIVVAATNRADILDKALLRPGRFDRKITIGLPDVRGREEIFGVHVKGKPVHECVDFNKMARVTPGFSGADIEALCNEAAIFAARADREQIVQDDFDEALEKLLIGLERDGSVLSHKKRHVVAVHEAGHAMTALLLDGYDEVRKVTISPRGGTGGVTQFLPQQDQLDSGLYSKDYLEKQLVVALGGRAAEFVAFGERHVTTGAFADMQQVYKIARAMVTQYGFNPVIGNIAFPAGEMHYSLSQATQKTIDTEILLTADEAYKIAVNLVKENEKMLEVITNALLERETLSGEELLVIVEPLKTRSEKK
jgi:cell division protease FtsH